MKKLLISVIVLMSSLTGFANPVLSDKEPCSDYKAIVDFYQVLLDSPSAKPDVDFLFQVLEWKNQAKQEYQSCLANPGSAERRAGVNQQY